MIRARVDLKIGQLSDIPVEILSFNDLSPSAEHVALIFKKADSTQSTPLVRMHSECLTGDVFHSSRCDCGEQLDETIEKMSQEGGILLYLRQEGRGIGLYNKLDAYELQSKGMNTYEANNHLGFDDDLRDFTDAANMLLALGVNSIKLITNNPKKVADLEKLGICITDVVGTKVYFKQGNENYLKAKALHGKHKLNIDSK